MNGKAKFELVGQIESVLNKLCFAHDSDCYGCPCNTDDDCPCELQNAVDNLNILLEDA